MNEAKGERDAGFSQRIILDMFLSLHVEKSVHIYRKIQGCQSGKFLKNETRDDAGSWNLLPE